MVRRRRESSQPNIALEPLEARLLLDGSVLISEFMAVNDSALLDGDGLYSDWIEIHNPTDAAVTLDGWYLTDDKGDAEWRFPDLTVDPDTVIDPGGYLVVFASNGREEVTDPVDPNIDPAGNWHTSFGLSGGGEYLGLLDNAANVVHEYDPYPQQFGDISYGIAQDVATTEFVASGDSASYLVPSADPGDWTAVGFDDSGWSTGQTGLGFSDLVGGFAVWNTKANTTVGHLDTALQVIDTPSMQSYVNAENIAVINYNNYDAAGHYGGDVNFPGFTGLQNDFVVEATGFVTIPSAGQWSFGVNSDDGFSLALDNGVDSFFMSYPGIRSAADSISMFTFTQAGPCSMRLVYYDRLEGAGVEMFAAPGSYASFNAAAFDLVGDTANGGLEIFSEPITGSSGGGAFAGLVETNVENEMKGVNASVFLRLPFTVADPAAVESLTLKMKYDDAYVAYLNGEPIAESNAPASAAWDSSATAERTDAGATTWETVDVSAHVDLLNADDGAGGEDNVLAIHAMNYTAADGDFLVLPELVEVAHTELGDHFFATATPGDANTAEYWLYVEDTKFDHDRGFYDAAFDLVITTATDGAAIYYTLDGTVPGEAGGTLFNPATPIHVVGTTVVRAAAFKDHHAPSDVDTQTYIFLDDVITQAANGQAPAGWPASWGSNTVDYGMDPDIVNHPDYAASIQDSLLAIPSLSVVMNLDDLFGSAGIYSHPGSHGIAWERPGSLELVDPAGDTDNQFQVEAGVRIRGGFSRSTGNPKHALRFFFRDEYGDAKLDFPLFGDEGTDEFNAIDLRTAQNYSWSFQGDSRNTFLRDIFARDVQGQMGQQYTRGEYYHLYINGMYWGLYQTDERAEASYGASYYGGDPDDYDVVKSAGSSGGYATEVTDGNDAAYRRLWEASQTGFETDEIYYGAQGMDADGTPNPAKECLLDVGSVIDYMIGIYYGGDKDAPISNFIGNNRVNNFFSIYNRENPTGFKFFRHDGEHTLDMGLTSRIGPFLHPDLELLAYFNPQTLHQKLTANADYRMQFADHVHRYFANGGVLTPEIATALVQGRAAEIDQAIIAESARWGDAKRTTPYTRETWVGAVSTVVNFLQGRTNTVLQQFKNAGWYPNVDAPTFHIDGTYQHGGIIGRTAELTVTAPAGTIHYTLDGTDPIDSGTVYAGAIVLPDGGHVKARVYDNGVWSALNEATFYIDLSPDIRVTEIMYNPGQSTADEIAAGYADNDDFEFIEVKNISATETLPLTGLRFGDGIEFTFPDMLVAPGQYVVIAKNPAAFGTRYSGFAGTMVGPFDLGTSLRNSGEKLRLDGPIGGMIHEFSYADGWYDHTDGDGFSLTIRDPDGEPALWDQADGWRASAAPGGSPGTGDTLPSPGSIVISEVLAHSDDPFEDVIELYNASGSPIDVTGWWLSDQKSDQTGTEVLTKYQIPTLAAIQPGGYVAFYEDADFGGAFSLSELGDDVYLSSNVGGVAGGYREHVDFGASPTNVSIGLHVKSTGGTDFTLLGDHTFGFANAFAFHDEIVINEIMYHPADPTPDEIAAGFINDESFEFIELYNASPAATRTLGEFHLSSGVGFTFGWYNADDNGNESWTLEPGATATWDATLPAGPDSYEVFARWDLLDAQGAKRDLDGQASYLITHDGGVTDVVRDQKPEDDDEGPGTMDVNGWVSLGTYGFSGSGQVVLTRGTNNPGNWTIADQVKFVSATAEVVVDDPVLGSWHTTNGPATLGPGQYVVIVSDYDAFDERYDIAGSAIPVAGQYTGSLSNNGEQVKLMRAGNPEPNGFIPHYRIDYVNYDDDVPWPVAPDGSGSSLSRLRGGGGELYGNDPASWSVGTYLGTPGAENAFVDPTPPAAPTNVLAAVGLVPATQVELTWTAADEPDSYVDHYVVYRDGLQVGTAQTTAYADTDVQPVTPYAYQVSAVNRDQMEGELSVPTEMTIPGIESFEVPDSTTISLIFSEPLDKLSAESPGNYALGGAGLTSIVLAPDGRTVVLTVSELVPGQQYTVTVGSIETVSGLLMPADQQVGFEYQTAGGGVLREYWTGIAGMTVADLTGHANYPDNPDRRLYVTDGFEAPAGFGASYGTRMRGYVHPDISGNYTFWIASDDAGQLYLSTDDDPANAVLIASVGTWTSRNEWDKFASQQSVEITLSAGQRYYIEAIHKDGGGADHLSVAWQLTEGTFEGPIGGAHLSPFLIPTLDTSPPWAPANVAAQSLGPDSVDLAWDAAVENQGAVDYYVIYRDGIEIATTAATSYSDIGLNQTQTHTYSVAAVNTDKYIGAAGVADPISPAPNIEVVTAVTETTVQVTFGEPVTQGTAEVAGNYSITYGTGQSVGVASASWDAGHTDQVTLALSDALAEGTFYTLGVELVADVDGTAIPPGSSMQFELFGSDLPALWPFDSDTDGFEYAADTFSTANPDDTEGTYEAAGGTDGGALRVKLGPGAVTGAMSGGWSRSFLVSYGGTGRVSLMYRMILGQGYESTEYGEVILEIDGTRYGPAANSSLVHVAGNGNGGENDDTGWQSTGELEVPLAPGNHTITIGAYNNRATYNDEWVEALIDDVQIDIPGLLSAPDRPDLMPDSDTGTSDSDDLTNRDNSAGDRTLQFQVAGTVAGKIVTIYADGQEIGSQTAAGDTTVVTTHGTHDMIDGGYAITARQAEPGQAISPVSAALAITVDTEAPAFDAWYSAAVHDGTELLLEIPDDGSFSEPRNAGLNTLVLQFSEAVDLSAASVALAGIHQDGDMLLSAVTADVTTRAPDRGQILFNSGDPLPDVARYLVRLDGAADSAGNPSAAGNERIMTALLGDTDGDLKTDVFDLRHAWNYRGRAADVGADQTRSDVNLSATVDTADLLLAWDRRGADTTGFADPVPQTPAQSQAQAPQAQGSQSLGSFEQPRGFVSLGLGVSSVTQDSGATVDPVVPDEAPALAVTVATGVFVSDDAPAPGDPNLRLTYEPPERTEPPQLDPDLPSGLTDPLTGEAV